jgi:hypothetical protein
MKKHIAATTHTFDIVRQERDLFNPAVQLSADLLICGPLQLRPRSRRVKVRGEQGPDVACRLAIAIFDGGEELELRLHAARGEDGERLAGVLPGLEGGDYIVEERGLELAVIVARFPELAWWCG